MRGGLRGLPLLLAVLATGCGSSSGELSALPGPPPDSPGPPDVPRPPFSGPHRRATSPLAGRMVELLLEYRERGDARALEEVRELLEHPPRFRDHEQPAGFDHASMPGVRYLAAFAARLQDDAEAERSILAPLRPEDRAGYEYLYGRPEEEVFADLRCTAVALCLEERAENPETSPLLLALAGLPGAEVPREQEVRCGPHRVKLGSCSPIHPLIWRSFRYRALRDAIAGLADGPSLEQLAEAAGLRPGLVVADIGAGEGFYSFRMAELVGAGGRVYAEEISPELVRYIAYRAEHGGYPNVLPVLGEPDHIPIPPGSADRVFLSLVVFDFEEMLGRLPPEEARRERHRFYAELVGLLAPEGRLVVLEHPEKKLPLHGRLLRIPFHGSPAWRELLGLGMEPLRTVPRFSSNVDLYVFGRRDEAAGGTGS